MSVSDNDLRDEVLQKFSTERLLGELARRGIDDSEYHSLVRELDVLLNGEAGAAKQASLCDLVGQLAEVRRTHEENVPADTLAQCLTLLDFSLSFALCNFDHSGTRRDVKRAQTRFEELKCFLQGESERYAKLCEQRAAYYDSGDDDGPDSRRGSACRACASVIRHNG